MSHQTTVSAKKSAHKGKMSSVHYRPAANGGGTVSCEYDSEGDDGNPHYVKPEETVHESAEGAHARMGELMGLGKKKADKK